eukprot:TRINITY_DN11793_c0_g1_i1.p1 TRINITY_DN11793_c0_g1~~TRINITY_DN11793_c0_g1_i1.p1  ORF type:complete len:662 (+),score=152.91 TRINITY_DN11793_c0_g1_i1:65-2050(+)
MASTIGAAAVQPSNGGNPLTQEMGAGTLQLPTELASRLHMEESVVSLFRPAQSGAQSSTLGEATKDIHEAAVAYLAKSIEIVHTPMVTESEIRARFLESAIPTTPQPLEEYIKFILPNLVDDSTRVSCGRQIGHMTGSLPQYAPPLAELVTAMNQNVVKSETSKTATLLEKQVIACLHRLIYNQEASFYDEALRNTEKMMGMFASGGTIANITGLWVARNVAMGPDLENGFPGIEQAGLLKAGIHYGYKGAVVIGSRLLHYSLKKATDVLGFGVEGLVTCNYDTNYQVDLKEVEAKLEECKKNRVCVVAIVGIAGATETGSVDDLEGLAALAKKYGTHFHVDAAWGGPCLFSRSLKKTLAGIEKADSVTIDGHKQLFMPMGCGMVLIKDPKKCHAVAKTANYIIRAGTSDLGRFTLEGSRPGTAIYMHANLSCIGASGYETLMNRSVRICRYMAQAVTKTGAFQVLFEPMMNILLYRFVPLSLRKKLIEDPSDNLDLTEEEWKELDQANVKLQEQQKAEGRTFVSRTTVFDAKHGRHLIALRVVIGNPVTEERDIDEVIADQLRIIGELATEEIRASTTSIGSSVSNGDLSPKDKTLSTTRSTASLCSSVNSADVSSASDSGEPCEYWKQYWERMPQEAKLFFMDSAERFEGSLVAPACTE